MTVARKATDLRAAIAGGETAGLPGGIDVAEPTDDARSTVSHRRFGPEPVEAASDSSDRSSSTDSGAAVAPATAKADHAGQALRCLTQALEHMQLGVTITDVEGQIIYTNPAEATLHGYQVEELIGRDIDVFAGPDGRRPLAIQDIRQMKSWRRESVNRRKDGSLFSVQLLSDVVHDADGNPVGVVTTCEDITERKSSEHALRTSREELDRRVMERTKELHAAIARLQAEMVERKRAEEHRVSLEAQLRHAQRLEAIGQLTGGIAHDFNNLLSVILGNAELLAATLPSGRPELRTSLDDIVAAARSGATMVHQLLGFARQAELNPAPTDLRVLVISFADMLRRLISDDVRLETYAEPPVGMVRADGGAVQQILMNLITNARDAMPHGGAIHITIQPSRLDEDYRARHPWVEPGEYVCLSVSDTGVGMDDEAKAKIFEPFFTTKPPGKGTGLGMAMVYGLMKQHRGYVHVYSEPGEGTKVSLYFPVVDAAVESAPASAPTHRERPMRGGETILVADDEDALRRTAVRALEKFGYRVYAASTGAQALSLFRAHRDEIDLVISDLVMPKMGGRELYEAIQREGGGPKFALSSGYSTRDVEARTILGARVPLIQKPWTVTELVEQVRRILDT